MNKPVDPLSLASAERIDALCDRFEAEWRANQQPRIEDLLESVPASDRAASLAALLRVEVELRQRAGHEPQSDDYVRRFPAESEVVSVVFAELICQPTTDTSVIQAQTRTVTLAHDRTTSFPPDEPRPVEIGRFAVLGILGEGAFGTVYRAHDPQLDREVAIKVPRREALSRPADVERFLRESKVAATMRHPNICPVYEVGMANGEPFIVMALVPGRSLAEHLKERARSLPTTQAAQIVRRLAQALELAHQKGIIHRDLKPANILIDEDRGDVVVMDFGLARREKSDAAQLTHSGMLMGTPAYMSPEQARGDIAAVGPASDIYSLGVILFELLTGERPFTGSVGEVLGKILHVEPRRPSDVKPDIDAVLESICVRAMARRPEDRHPSMLALAEDLRGWLKANGADDIDRVWIDANPGQESADGTIATGPNVEAIRRSPRPPAISPPSKWRVLWKLLPAAGFGAILIAAATIILLKTRYGTVQIEISDPAIRVIVDKDDQLTFRGVDAKHLIKLKPGEHGLTITRGDFTFHTPKFEVRNPKTTLKVGFLAPNIVVSQDGKVLSTTITESLPTQVNHALLFDGIDDYVEVSGWEYTGDHPLTVEAWVTPEKLSKGVEFISTSEQSGFNLAIWQDNRWVFSVVAGTRSVCAKAPFKSEHSNHRIHIAGVYDRQQVRLYVGGIETERVAAPAPYKTSIQPLILGGNPNRGEKIVFHYAGLIDEVRISRTGRYAGNFIPTERHEPDAETMVLYHFDEGEGNVLKDSSVNELHGKIVGANWVTYSPGTSHLSGSNQ